MKQRDDKDINESVSEGSEEEIGSSKTNSASNLGNVENTSCACQRLTIHVLDISKVFTNVDAILVGGSIALIQEYLKLVFNTNVLNFHLFRL